MITIEDIEKAFGDDRTVFQTKDIDHDITAISLLRSRIPYDVCRSIIQGASHDMVHLCNVEKILPYLSKEDLDVLADCNVCYDSSYESLYLFV